MKTQAFYREVLIMVTVDDQLARQAGNAICRICLLTRYKESFSKGDKTNSVAISVIF
jgi:hypothetical protein